MFRILEFGFKLSVDDRDVCVMYPSRNDSETVESLSELCSVGSFAQINVMGDNGDKIELVLVAERRIRVLEPVIDDVDSM